MLDESLQFCKRSNLSAKQRRAMDKAKYKQRYDALSKGTLRLDMVDEKNGDISIVEIADYSDPETAMMAKQAIYEKVQKRRHGKKRGPPTADAKDPDQKQVLEDVAAAFQSLCLPRPSSV